jgi:RNA polymerase sigma-70 factor (ECF subfamily)
MQDEKELLSRLKAGDRSAFAEMVEQHSPRIFNLALRMMEDPAEAEEILQETFLRAAKHIHSFRGHSSLGTWLYRIGTNLALMRLRRKRPVSISLDDTDEQFISPHLPAEDWSDRPESELLNREARAEMQRAILTLPDGLRIVFVLRDIEGLSTAEAADVLNLSISAVKSRLLRARLALRNELSRYFSERATTRRRADNGTLA